MTKHRTFTPEMIEACGRQGWNQSMIASVYGISQPRVSQIMQKPAFREAYERGRANLKAKLIGAQIDSACERLDKTMLIWLGKQYLGQVDAPQTRHVEIDQRVSVRYVAEWGRDDQEISGGTANVIEAGEDDWEEEE